MMRSRDPFGSRTARALLACATGLCFLALPNAATARPGNLDRSFSGDGIVRLVGQQDKLFNATAIAVQPGMGIVVAGGRYTRSAGTDWSLTRRLFNGRLDTSFGAAGYREIEFSPGHDYAVATDLVSLPDGRLLVSGFAVAGDDPEEFPAEMVVARLDRDGDLDSTFGDAGVRTVHPGTNTGWDVKMAVAPDGGIVLARSTGLFPDADFEISKLTPDGSLDTSFGDAGSKLIDFADREDQLTDLAIGRGGRIVVVGSTERWRDEDFKRSDLAVARLTGSGRRDDSFSRNGRRIVDNGRYDLDPVIDTRRDRRLVIAGETGARRGGRIVVLRLARNGSLDKTFSRDGFRKIRIRDFAQVEELALQRRGRVVVFGSTAFNHPVRGGLARDWAVLRLTRNGRLDRSFSGNGKVITDAGGNEYENRGADLALQPNGKIVVGSAGCCLRGPGGDYVALARYRSDLRPAR